MTRPITRALSLVAACLMAGACIDEDVDEVFGEEDFVDEPVEDDLFIDWDRDRNGLLSEEEFDEGFYDEFDLDADGLVDDEEFGDENFDLLQTYDVDANGLLDESELDAMFETFDRNRDGFIERAEFELL